MSRCGHLTDKDPRNGDRQRYTRNHADDDTNSETLAISGVP